MQQGDLRTKGGVHLTRHRRGQADLRHHQQGRFARIERAPHRRYVHGRLPAAGDAMQQVRTESSHGHSGRDACKGLCLCFVQRVFMRMFLAGSVNPAQVKCRGGVLEAHQAALHQRSQA